nr:Predicted transcriptional regulators (HipB) [uncultured Mediterranean phage uvMED]|tara:strand:- start:19 stop:405 length:387 start_codon:yes stop_codon:yes gene_type:complete
MKKIEKIGDRVKKERERLGLTQDELAKKVSKDLSFQNIGNLEQGKIKRAPMYVDKLATVLGVTVDYLMQGHTQQYQINEQIHELLATDRPTDIDFSRTVWIVSTPAGEQPILSADEILHGKIIKKFDS